MLTLTYPRYSCFPCSYPHVIVTPDGNLAVAAKSSLVKYNRVGDGSTQGTRFNKAWQWPDRPGAAWVYPQTGELAQLGRKREIKIYVAGRSHVLGRWLRALALFWHGLACTLGSILLAPQLNLLTATVHSAALLQARAS